jgi:hypothetical protein
MDVLRELRTNPYDVLLITEQHGVIDSLLSHDAVRHLRHYHDRFIDGNARGRTFFYEPWLGIPGRTELRRWIDYERASAPLWQCIVTRVNRSLEAEGRSDRVTSLPVGLALAELMEQASRGAVEGLSGATPDDTVGRIFHDNVHLTPAVAVLVLLAAAARAGVVAPDLGHLGARQGGRVGLLRSRCRPRWVACRSRCSCSRLRRAAARTARRPRACIPASGSSARSRAGGCPGAGGPAPPGARASGVSRLCSITLRSNW